MHFRTLLPSFFVLFFLYPASSQVNQANDAMLEIMEQSPIAGLAVAVVKKDQIIYQNSYGMKDLEEKIPMTNESLFRIASISKSLTATALMQLAEQKRLSLLHTVSQTM